MVNSIETVQLAKRLAHSKLWAKSKNFELELMEQINKILLYVYNKYQFSPAATEI